MIRNIFRQCANGAKTYATIGTVGSRRFKELCDDGIITEKEFEDRKQELLRFKYID